MGGTSAEAGHRAEPGETGSAGSSKPRSGIAEQQQRAGRGSPLMDAPGFKSVEELLELAEETHGWVAEVRKLDPDLANDQKSITSRDATFTLDVSALEWKRGADIHDGVFRG